MHFAITRRRLFGSAAVLGLAFALPMPASALAAGKPDLAARLDSYLTSLYPAGEPGATVLVERGGQVLLRKGYGLAQLELEVPNRPETVFEIGSITKQFTAAAVLMLVEEGKIKLEDDFTRYLPDYPKPAQTVTVENLLTHTSGIPSYTDLPEWMPRVREDMTPDQLASFFRDKPLDFAPGERWSYSNSAYVVLGMIVEKASGMTYEKFVEERIFAPLGMKDSRYGHAEEVVPRRAAGYDKGESGYLNARYISMTLPYSAGALMSTVDDLERWNRALAEGKILSAESRRRMETPFAIKSGQSTRYGFGLEMGELEGHRMVAHSGGIFGFLSMNLRLPDDRLEVIVLSNNPDAKANPTVVARRLAGLVLDLPDKPKAVALPAATLEAYVGVYRINDKEQRFVRRDGDQLTTQRSGGSRSIVRAQAADRFFYDDTDSRLGFVRDAAGKVVAMEMDSGFGPVERAEKTAAPLPAERVAVEVAPAILDTYVGVYELAPGFSLTVTRKGSALIATPTGQEADELMAVSESEFAVQSVDALITFGKDEKGAVNGLVLHQGAHETRGKKVK
jgi:D-alanyl-D-alanine carboxypeptidase